MKFICRRRAASLVMAVLLAWAGVAVATSVEPMALDAMVERADHVVVGTVTGVEMVDGRGRAVHDASARTGPGLANRMYLVVQVNEVLRSTATNLPSTIRVPLWSMWHYSLGGIREAAQGSEGIFLLTGAHFEPAYPSGFQRGLEEREAVQALLGGGKPAR